VPAPAASTSPAVTVAGYGSDLAAYDAAAGFDAEKAAIGMELLSDLCCIGDEDAIGAAIGWLRRRRGH
jgi:hypothetical protein